ncbi:NB-ARC domain-containing protein [Streptomyces sp. DSM 44917]|uniref:NB-ARC domain-containing protein n=1 Tax=Streptomyces boetiae TaxID=3075541 RepID=A0ABU2LFV4_9ACTN|nr:NB-ARC domain-containing protein [Streptomyces sp. DSM 44917]MDT0310456.1 NB-ARC domain-containing protein [Streptomyces sp. DSM 44917]
MPPSTPWFVDRAGALAWWSDLLGRTERRPACVAVVSGMRGVGKSTLVRRMAEEAGSRFPGGQFHVNLLDWRGEAGSVDVSGALRGCLRALGVTEPFLPTALPDLTGLFRTMTARSSVLVVLDEVTEPAQVEPFVPKAAGSVVLAVSDARLAELVNVGALPLPVVRPLERTDALELLALRCGQDLVAADRVSAENLVEWCGGLPLALDLIAGRLTLDPEQTLSDLIAELAEDGAPLDDSALRETRAVTSALTAVYRNLPERCRRLYAGLALFPGSEFDADIAAVIADVPPAAAGRLLRVLEETSLITHAGAPEDRRYRFYELARTHALAQAEERPGAERRAALRRVVEYFRVRAACADRAVMADRYRVADHATLLAGVEDPFAGGDGADGDDGEDGGDGKAAALAWLLRERGNALAVLRAAVAEGLFTAAWQLAEALTALYLNHRFVRDWIESGELGIEAAACERDGGNEAAEARLSCLLSRPLADDGQLERARALMERAVPLADRTGDLVLRASAREFLGRLWERDDPERAIALFGECARLNARAGERRGVALAEYFVGCAETGRGRHRAALDRLGHALGQFLALRDGKGDQRMAGRALVALGRAHLGLGHGAEAGQSLSEGADLLKGVGAVAYELPARRLLADLAQAEGDDEAERAQLARMLGLLIAGGSPEAAAVRERLDALGGPP